MPSRLEFDLNPRPRVTPRHNTPMRLLVMGNFSGQPSADKLPLASRPTLRVDADTLDTVMRQLAPRAAWPEGEHRFTSIDDLHPDALFANLRSFEDLRQARQSPPLAAAQAPTVTQARDSNPTSGADLLAGLLGGRPPAARPEAVQTPAVGMEAFIRHIVAPHIVASSAPDHAQWQAAADAAIAARMRTLLHDAAFKSLEAAWRGLHWLVSNLELDEQLQLHVFDVGREELLADVVAAQGRLAQTGLHQALADRWQRTPDASGWSACVALFAFGPSDADIGLAAALGLIAAQAGGPLLAGGDTALATAEPQALMGWQALRRSEAAPWLGMVAPRLLLRLPYGRRGDPIGAFAFEEFPGGTPDHEHLLWGTGSLAAALLIGRAFSARGWAFEPGDEREIGDLPAYSFERDGESELQPCAEHALGEQAGQALLDAGLMPLLSHRHRNAATLLRFQSIALPAQPLAGLRAG